MDELKRIFLEAGVAESVIESIIDSMGLTTVEDLAYFTDATAFAEAGVSGMLAQRKLAAAGAGIKAEREAAKQREAQIAAERDAQKNLDLSLLAEDVNEEEWIRDLQQGGILRFQESTYIAGIKAVLAANMGVFRAVETLSKMVTDYSIKSAIPSPKLFYTLQDIITRREYGLVFAASENNRVNGVPIYATSKDMEQLMQRMMQFFVPAILDSAQKVAKWYNDLTNQKTSDFFVEQTMHESALGQSTSYPSPAALYDAGVNLRQSINQTFAGNGIQKALAIYNEYRTFVGVLNDPDLPSSVGALDKDNVLSMLGFDANAAAVRSEAFIVKFVISMIDAERLAKGKELQFFRELHDLARQIDWSALTGNPKDAQLIATASTPLQFIGNPGVTGAIPAATMAQPSQPMIGTEARLGIQQMNGKALPEIASNA